MVHSPTPPTDNEASFDSLPPALKLNVLGKSKNPEASISVDAVDRDIAPICEKVTQDRSKLINRFSEQTPMTEKQAVAYSLRRYCSASSPRMSLWGIALYMEWWDDGTEHSPESVQSLLKEAQAVITEAVETVGAVNFPDRDEHLESPALMWADESTTAALECRADREAKFVYEVLEEIVEEALNISPLRKQVEAYIEQTNPAQVAVVTEPGTLPEKPGDTLHLVAHIPDSNLDGSEAKEIRELDCAEVFNTRFRVSLAESSQVPQEDGRHNLYASGLGGMQSVELEEGIAGLRGLLPTEG